MDVGEWLRRLGLERYELAFRENNIDYTILPKLTAEDLKDLGVSLVGDRRRLLDAIAALRGESIAVGELAGQPSTIGQVDPIRVEAERRHLTVLFCDLAGSTALSAGLDPEDTREVIGAYHRCCDEQITKTGGFVAKYMGDGVLAYFGYPQAHEDDAERAVHAALSLVAGVPKLRTRTAVPLQVRVGIATGLVVVGDMIGEGIAREHGVIGDTPNLAARLQALAEPNSIVIAESTRRQIGTLFDVLDLGELELKGFAKPHRVWRVLGESSIHDRFAALRSGGTLLLGRDEELEILERRWQSARSGEGRVALLTAEPGFGKSRLAAALVATLRSQPHATLQLFCSPHHQDSALFPVIAYLERAAGFEREETAAAQMAKLEALVTASSTILEDVALFGELLSLPPSCGYMPVHCSPQRKKEKTLDAFMRHIMGAGEHQPVVLIFEDIHWIDPTSRDLLDTIIRGIERARVLVIATFRPEFQSPWASLSHVTSLTLVRLAPKEASALVRQIGHDATPLPDDVIQEIVVRSDGVPLFLEEVTKAVLETGVHVPRTEDADSATTRLVPATLHASLIARLDRIGAAAKEIAQIGATIGREFSYELLAATWQRAASELNEALVRLVEAGLIFQRGTVPAANFLFKHALVQDVAYATLLRNARRDLHGQIADALLATSDAEAAAPEIIARHLQIAERAAEATAYWQKAGEQSVWRANNREAVGHFRRALSLLETQPQTTERRRIELAILSQLGPALMSVHGWAAAEAGEVVERASEIGRQLESTQEVAQSIANLWLFHYANGRLEAAKRISDDLFRIAHELDSSEVKLQAHHTAWPIRWSHGALSEAIGHIDAGLALYDEERHAQHRFLYLGHDPAVCGLAISSQLYAAIGLPARAVEAGERALSLARRLRHEPTLVHGLWFVIESHATRQDMLGVIAHTAELLKLAEQYGLPQPQAMGLAYRGWALASLGNTGEGVPLVEEGIGLLERSGTRVFLSRTYGLVAEAYLRAGRCAEGLKQVDKAILVASEVSESFYLPRLFEIRAKLLEASGEADDAVEESLRRALTLARQQGAIVFELRAAVELVRQWRRQGKNDGAVDLLRTICGQFTDGFDSLDFKNAQKLLD